VIRHFIVERDSRVAREWDPRNSSLDLPLDCPYFGKVLTELEEHLPEVDLHCYLTWDWRSLPEYGNHVITILVGEERGLIPRYSRHIRMVARVMSHYPFLGIRRWWPPNRMILMLVPKYFRNWVYHFWSWLQYSFPPSSWPDSLNGKPLIVHLPWGCASLCDVPMKQINQRTQNYFFSGRIARGANFGYRKILSSPKIVSRKSLVAAVERLEEKHKSHPSNDSIVVHRDKNPEELKDGDHYAQHLMDSKVCLAPRGSVADTWRFFEGLKSGCIVITNPLPDQWYYRGAPVIQIDDWNELEKVIIPLLGDNAKMEAIHVKALKYWDEICGEKAVGRYLASVLSSSR